MAAWTERGRGRYTVNYQNPEFPGIAITEFLEVPGRPGYFGIHHVEGRSRNVNTFREALDVATIYRDEHTHHYRPKGPAASRRLVCVCGEVPRG